MIFFPSSVIQSIIVILAAVFVSSSSATNIRLASTAAAAEDEYIISAPSDSILDGKSLLVILKDEEGVDPEEKCASLASSTGVGDNMIIVNYVDTYLRACFMKLLLPAEAAEEAAAALATLKNDPSVEYADTNEGHGEEYIDAFIEDEGDDELADDFDEDEDEDEESSNIFMMADYVFGYDRLNQCLPNPDASNPTYPQKRDAKGTAVFILHAGNNKNHPDIIDSIGQEHIDYYPYTESTPASIKVGTDLARYSCGKQFGVAKNCRILDIRVLPGNKNYNGNDIFEKVIRGLDYVIQRCNNYYSEINCVVNMSIRLGHGTERDKLVKQKIEEAVDAGNSVVAHSGNCDNGYGTSPKVISVGRINKFDEKMGAYGECVTVYSPAEDHRNAVARVTGIVAGIRGKHPNFNPNQVKDKLVNDATWNSQQEVLVVLVDGRKTADCPKQP